jgi:hypothetical protein
MPVSLAPKADATVMERLLPGLVVAGVAILVMILVTLYSVVTGESSGASPLRWLAAIMLLAGVALCIYRVRKRG